jgi:hypothetical protein
VPRKFLEGLVFGAGFALSFIALGWVALSLSIRPGPGSMSLREPVRSSLVNEDLEQFYKLPIEEQIKKSSVIALARFEPSPDGRMRAVLKEFLKKDPAATFYYNIGDEYPSASYYPTAEKRYGDGVVVLFVGSPAEMRLSMTFTGDRIHTLGDMPLELLRKKCNS